MSSELYVSTDSAGVEHAASGPVRWHLPPDAEPTVAAADDRLHLREPVALLDVLEELVFRAEPSADAVAGIDGVVSVTCARLVGTTPWDSEVATRFALDCAEHALESAPDAALPGGTKLAAAIDHARQVLDHLDPGSEQRLGYLARLYALRRLRHDRAEIADLSLMQMLADEAEDLDALDDPAYAEIIPVIDAVLGAIEALRHHVVPHLYEEIEQRREEREDVDGSGDSSERHIPIAAQTTPFGPLMFGGGSPVLRYEPSGVAAREAARHARIAARLVDGEAGEEAERAWQSGRLASLLSGGAA